MQQLGCSQLPHPPGARTQTLPQTNAQGEISLYCYINLTNTPNTARDTEQIKC